MSILDSPRLADLLNSGHPGASRPCRVAHYLAHSLAYPAAQALPRILADAYCTVTGAAGATDYGNERRRLLAGAFRATGAPTRGARRSCYFLSGVLAGVFSTVM